MNARARDSHLRSLGIPAFPRGWYYFATSRELSRGVVAREICGQRFVGFRTKSGAPTILAAACASLGGLSGCKKGGDSGVRQE